MAAQNELRWLLDTLVTAWPTTGPLGGTAPPATVAFRDRDEPATYYYPTDGTEPATLADYEREREQAVPTDGYRTVGVATGTTTQEFFGNKPQYDVETTLDVRIQEKSVYENGACEDIDAHNTLVAAVQRAVNTTITYPEVDPDADAIGRVVYLDAGIVDVDRQSREFKDQFLTTFSVRLRGRAEPLGGESDTTFESAFEGPFVG